MDIAVFTPEELPIALCALWNVANANGSITPAEQQLFEALAELHGQPLPKLGPIVRDWREHHSVPRGAKILATAMMAISCTGAWFFAPLKVAWIPTAACTIVGVWLWRLPTRGKSG